MIKNIIFDLGGVIIDLDRKRCLDNFRELLGFPDFGIYLSAYLQGGFFADFEDGAIDAAEFRRHIRERSSNKDVADSQIDFALSSFLSGIKEEKGEMLLALKKRGYKLYLLSNNNPIAWRRSEELLLESTGISGGGIFDGLFLSYLMKLSKPGRGIFEKVLLDTGVAPQETLFIDDAPANIETASGMGFATILYNPEESLPLKVAEALAYNG